MNEKKFIAELHDIGKLVDHQNCAYMIFHWFKVRASTETPAAVPQNKTNFFLS